MIKKLILGMFAAAGILFAASCSHEEAAPSLGESALVTLNLDLKQGLGTKAASSDIKADKLVYAVYDAQGKLVSKLAGSENGVFVKEDAFKPGQQVENVAISLFKGQQYTVAFWAQNSECKAYTVIAGEDSFDIAVDYNGANNDETREAFSGSVTFQVEDGAVIDVVLKRPFAQVNLAVTNEYWDEIVAAGINILQSKAKIAKASTSLNVLTGEVSGETAVEYGYANIPSTVATKAEGESKDLIIGSDSHKWLSMSYILTGAEKSVLGANGIEFTLLTENGQELVVNQCMDNVPVQGNWRTNLVSDDLLTTEVDFNITIDPIYYYNVANVHNSAELAAAIQDKSVEFIKLAPGEYDVFELMLGQHKIFQSVEAGNPAVIRGRIGAADNSHVEFYNIKFVATAKGLEPMGHQHLDKFERKSVVPVYYSKAIFKNCEFVDVYNSHMVAAINYGGHKPGVMMEIDNCKFQGYGYSIYSRALLSVTNCTFNQRHTDAHPRAVFLYGLNGPESDKDQGHVIFQNNVAVDDTQFCIQLTSSNYCYRKIHFDVKNNVHFKAVPYDETKASAFLVDKTKDFTGCTFAEGSETFTW